MNLRRGFLRAWVVLSVVWVVAVGAVNYDRLAFTIAGPWRGDILMLPVSCTDGGGPRGTEGPDYVRNLETGKPWTAYTCWYAMPRFRALYPEYADLSDDTLADKLYRKIDKAYAPRGWLLGLVVSVSALALLPPLVVLLLGLSIGWVIGGFRGRRPSG